MYLCVVYRSHWLRGGRFGHRIPVWARFSTSVQTGPGAHPASFTMGTVSFLGLKSGRGVTLTPHPLLTPWSRQSKAIPLLPVWTVWPVQSLIACTRVNFTVFTDLTKQRILPYTALSDGFLITEATSVYFAVRAESLYMK